MRGCLKACRHIQRGRCFLAQKRKYGIYRQCHIRKLASVKNLRATLRVYAALAQYTPHTTRPMPTSALPAKDSPNSNQATTAVQGGTK